jgi:predicted secreted protein
MGIPGSLLVIVVAWWLAFFALLPIGMRSHGEDGTVIPGTEPSAPAAPRLWLKAIGALVIAIVLWLGLYAVIEYRLIDIHDIPIPSGIRWN